MNEHDIALVKLRFGIYGLYWDELIVQRAQSYLVYGPAVAVDAAYRAARVEHGRQWDLGFEMPFPRKPEIRYRVRRELGLPDDAETPRDEARAIPDLYWPGLTSAPPVVIEYENDAAAGRAIRAKARHLDGLAHQTGARVVVVYRCARDLKKMLGVWTRALSYLPYGLSLTVEVIAMADLETQAAGQPNGLSLLQPCPGATVISSSNT